MLSCLSDDPFSAAQDAFANCRSAISTTSLRRTMQISALGSRSGVVLGLGVKG